MGKNAKVALILQTPLLTSAAFPIIYACGCQQISISKKKESAPKE